MYLRYVGIIKVVKCLLLNVISYAREVMKLALGRLKHIKFCLLNKNKCYKLSCNMYHVILIRFRDQLKKNY